MGDENVPQHQPAVPAAPRRKLARDLLLYTLARLVLLALIAGLIVGAGRVASVDVPLIVAMLFALVIALPLSYVLFRALRVRVNEDIAAVDEKRRQDKARLRARLRGDNGPESGPDDGGGRVDQKSTTAGQRTAEPAEPGSES